MPILEVKDYTKRELQTKKRFEGAYKVSKVLKDFFEKGFRSFEALKSIMAFYYPEVDENQLFNLWNFRVFDEDIADKLMDVFEKLKSE